MCVWVGYMHMHVGYIQHTVSDSTEELLVKTQLAYERECFTHKRHLSTNSAGLAIVSVLPLS